jgi:hypothetical protein
MRIEINYRAETLQTAICEAIVTYLGYGMPAREIIDQLISSSPLKNLESGAFSVSLSSSSLGDQVVVSAVG